MIVGAVVVIWLGSNTLLLYYGYRAEVRARKNITPFRVPEAENRLREASLDSPEASIAWPVSAIPLPRRLG